ncbi:MAG: Na/Pi cotransporter family protein [Deltaproteobacteria bacterium]|nr:Na/Pi cotransporter family protein [Deltaproteobacteria bacterium]
MAREAVVETSRNLEEEIIIMCHSTKEMLEATRDGFRRQDNERLDQAEKIGREIHQKEKELTYLIMTKLSKKEETVKEIESLGLLPGYIERIGDNIELLIRCIRTMNQEGTLFSERAIKEINTLFDKAIELLECVRDALRTKNKVLIKHIKEEGKKFQEMISEYSLAHLERLIEGTCMSKASSVYLAILDYLAEIERHIRQMADKIFI